MFYGVSSVSDITKTSKCDRIAVWAGCEIKRLWLMLMYYLGICRDVGNTLTIRSMNRI
jgi:hypothetical protein